MKIPVKPLALIILDGWGIDVANEGNAIEHAKKPYFEYLIKTYPHTQLKAAGEAVGLSHNDDGNSEVGHMNLGAGKIVYENVIRINQSISEGSFTKNPAFLGATNHVNKNNSALHLIGLFGNGVVHSTFEHLVSLLRLCKQQKVEQVYIHIITDGRDSGPHEAATLLRVLEEKINQVGTGKIASVMGRYFAMDRDLHWDRTKRAYDCLTIGTEKTFQSPDEAIKNSYDNGITDEFIFPVTITNQNNVPIGLIRDNDAVIFFNYREDRARQLTKAFVLPEFETAKIFRSGESREQSIERKTFDRNKKPTNLFFATMIEYEKNLSVSAIAFPTPMISIPLAKIIAKKNLRQFHIAETEKYAHVTYFFNGGREDPFKGEDRVLVPSPSVPTYDLKPEMSAREITDVTLERLEMNRYDFMIINYANADMVAHTGNFKATVTAIETVDSCLKRLVDGILNKGGCAIVTADHGNAEELCGENGEVDTKHSNNEVPFILIEPSVSKEKITLQTGILADVAPTIVYLMGLTKPKDMTGVNLVEYNKT